MAFAPDNPLELALMRAATDPAMRPEFYRLLLESQLLVIGKLPDDHQTNLEAGQSVAIANVVYNGRNYIPVFSSMVRLRAFLTTEESYLSMKGRDLFENMAGAYFMLNPGSDYGKELLPDEIASVLAPAVPRTYTVDKPTQVKIGAPAEYPTALVQALTSLFRSRPEIVSARLVQIQFEDGIDQPHPLIGIETEGAWDPLSAAIGHVCATVVPGKQVDAIQVSRIKKSDTLNATLLQTQPFYTRSRAPH